MKYGDSRIWLSIEFQEEIEYKGLTGKYGFIFGRWKGQTLNNTGTVHVYLSKIPIRNDLISQNIIRFGLSRMQIINELKANTYYLFRFYHINKLRSQFATSNSKVGRGGTQYLPYAFTEHGVLQIANLINTELADSVSVFVVRAFVEMRRTIVAQQKALVNNINAIGSEMPKAAIFHKELIPKLHTTIGRILDSVIDNEKGTTVKDEALDILKESISHLKEQLRKKGLQNEEITFKVIGRGRESACNCT